MVANDAPFMESLQTRMVQTREAQRLLQTASSAGAEIVRPLLPTEVTALDACKNRCKDWSKIRLWVDEDKDMSAWLEKHVNFNGFGGKVVIRVAAPLAETTSSTSLSPGIHFNSMISNCVLGSNCRVYRNVVLQDTYVGNNATVLSNGQITCDRDASYGALSITVGPESGGGRELNVTAESNMIDVCRMMGMGRPVGAASGRSVACPCNVIGDNCIVRDTPTVQSIFMAPGSRIEAATLVQEATLLSTAMIGHSSTAQRVLLQWNSSISHQSHISDTLLMEHAHAGPHSIVAETILGPDVHVSAGEVHASVIGPNTNSHHQSLVIGVLWPLGRGNVGYGANVGSNHTGRIPDQETVAGEGTFWGLSTVIKFPVDLSLAPYSLVAAGTTMIPQRVTMPFSLCVDESILPGWVLHSSPYTLSRSETKFATRRKAKHHDFYTGWKIIRPSTMNLCCTARQSLIAVGAIKSEYKTEKEIPGIGKLVLSEKARQSGITAYTSTLQRYALTGLLEYCQHQGLTALEHELASTNASAAKLDDLSRPTWGVLPWEEEDLWSHQKTILRTEFPREDAPFSTWISTLLQELVHLERDYADRIASCKQRDDVRGQKTIPGYQEAHVAAKDDAVVHAAKNRADEVEQAVQAIVLQGTATAVAARSRL